MYSFIFEQAYINLLILIIIVFLVMFLWRKVIILEGNFFVLEKRVNLIKKDAREDSITKNIEKSDIIMNEIFKDYCPINACKNFDCFPSVGGNGDDKCAKSANNISITEDVVQYISQQVPTNLGDMEETPDDIDVITFTNHDTININDLNNDEADVTDEVDIDKMVNSIISSSEDYEKKIITEHKEYNEHSENIDIDNMSVTSDITFTSDDKKNEKTLIKKYSKMPLEKLKEFCSLNNINTDGTKNQLITRIIENKK